MPETFLDRLALVAETSLLVSAGLPRFEDLARAQYETGSSNVTTSRFTVYDDPDVVIGSNYIRFNPMTQDHFLRTSGHNFVYPSGADGYKFHISLDGDMLSDVVAYYKNNRRTGDFVQHLRVVRDSINEEIRSNDDFTASRTQQRIQELQQLNDIISREENLPEATGTSASFVYRNIERRVAFAIARPFLDSSQQVFDLPSGLMDLGTTYRYDSRLVPVRVQNEDGSFSTVLRPNRDTRLDEDDRDVVVLRDFNQIQEGIDRTLQTYKRGVYNIDSPEGRASTLLQLTKERFRRANAAGQRVPTEEQQQEIDRSLEQYRILKERIRGLQEIVARESAAIQQNAGGSDSEDSAD